MLPLYAVTRLFLLYAVNIPHWDDHAIKAFIVQFQQTDDLFEKLRLLLKQHNEHRIATTRLAALLLTKYEGTLNFKHLMLIGNASLLGLWGYFIISIKNYRLPWVYITIISLLLFTVAIAENFYWGMAAVQNFGVIFFAFSTFYFLSFDFTDDVAINKEFVFTETGQKKHFLSYLNIWLINTFRWQHIYFYLAAISAILAVLSSGNGLIVPILGFVTLLLVGYFRKAIFWLLPMGFIVGLYFLFDKQRPDAVTNSAVISGWMVFKGVITLAGGVFDTNWIFPTKRLIVAQIVGFLLLIPTFSLFYKTLQHSLNGWLTEYKNNAYRTDLFLAICLIFIVGTAIGTVINRLGYGYDVFLTGKYKIYGILWLSIVLLYLQRISYRNYRFWLAAGSLLVASYLWFNGYFNDFIFVRHQQIERMGELANWQLEAQKEGKQLETYPYNPPTVSVIDTLRFDAAVSDTSLIDNIQLLPEGVLFTENNITLSGKSIYMVLKSPKHHYIYPVLPVRNSSRTNIFKTYFQQGFMLEVSSRGLPTELYQLYLLERKGKIQTLFYTEKIIRIEGLPADVVQQAVKNW